MVNLIYARSEAALKNGSFYHHRKGPRTDVITQFVNGDYMGEVQTIPAELRTWNFKDAKELMPRTIAH